MEKVDGVRHAAVVMATPLNKRVLSDLGFSGHEVEDARSDDLVVAIEAEDETALDHALAQTDKLLVSPGGGTAGRKLPTSLSEAVSQNPNSNLVVVSVPGAYAKREAMTALEAGMNVFLFSSNVPREDERELKEFAVRKNLLMMGPDCGTAIINHVILGFGNAVRKGSIGIVSASGTGLQEVSTMIHRRGLGISQAIGTGGGDLSDTVGGITTIQGLELLGHDPATTVIVVISKPPGTKSLKGVLAAIRRIRKPVVVNFLGADRSLVGPGKYKMVSTLKQAADTACELAGEKSGTRRTDESRAAFAEASRLSKSQKYVRGLFAGGTLCYEAQVVMSSSVGRVYSNVPLDKKNFFEGTTRGRENTCVDMGAEEFVVGRAHPMIDFTLRKMRILEEAKDPEVAVLLLDVELGLGSNPDPAAELVPTIKEAKSMAVKRGGYISVVASMIGTDGDFQNLSAQVDSLTRAGVIVTASNAEAAELSALIATRGATPSRRSA